MAKKRYRYLGETPEGKPRYHYIAPSERYEENTARIEFDIWDRIAGTEFLEQDERIAALDLFYDNFVEAGHNRETFFEYMGMEPSEFPWEDWREWMGYE